MAEISERYRANVGREQGGNLMYMKAAGLFKFFDTDYTGMYLRNFLLSRVTTWEPRVSSDGGDDQMMSTHSRFLTPYGHILFSGSTGDSLLSILLPLPSIGQYLAMNFTRMIGDANISIWAQSGGGLDNVSLIDVNGLALSSFEVSAMGKLLIVCDVDQQWSVIERNSSVTANLAA